MDSGPSIKIRSKNDKAKDINNMSNVSNVLPATRIRCSIRINNEND